MQGGHELHDLNSGRVITRARVAQIPVTDVVIKAIDSIAEDQEFKSLKFKNRKGPIFHDADWIAGVDYDENIPQEDDYDKDWDENNNKDPDEDIEDDQNDWIDEDELEDLNKDAKEEDNPNQHQEQDEIENEEQNEQESEDEGTAVISEPELDSQTSEVRKSTRTSQPVEQLEPNMTGKLYIQNDKTKKKVSFASDELRQLEYCHNLVAQFKPDEEMNIEYWSNEAMLIARFIQDITMNVNGHRASFAQQYMLQKGLKVFGYKGHKASMKEIDQLHKRTCFAALNVKEVKHSERKKAQMALMFLAEKRDKSVKGRMVYNGRPTREWLSWEDAASPTAALESILITGVIEAKEERDVMTCDIPNAFIQAYLPKKEPEEDRVVMKITGVLVDMHKSRIIRTSRSSGEPKEGHIHWSIESHIRYAGSSPIVV
jgi:hypothetical protein